MKEKLILLFTVVLVGFSSGLKAQETNNDMLDNQVIIYLKGGSQFEGEIIYWKYNEEICIKTNWADNLIFKQEEIEKVVQKSTLKEAKTKMPYNFEESGIYYSLKGQLLAGNAGSRANSRVGFGVAASAGYKLNRLLALGLGVGYDMFIWQSGEDLIPVFAEISGFFSPKMTTAYYNLQLGYAFAQKDEQYLLTEAKGGIMVYPAVGIRFGSSPAKYTLDLGYKFQEASFTYEDAWTNASSEQDLTYKRLSLRFGVIF